MNSDLATEGAAAEPQAQRRVYAAHREKQRRHILATAQALFDQRGIDRVTVTDITAASGLRSSTIYQYFASKDDIVWVLVQEVMEYSAATLQLRAQQPSGTALAAVAAILVHLGEELVSAPERVRFMAQFDALYARDWSAEQLSRERASGGSTAMTSPTTIARAPSLGPLEHRSSSP